MNYLQFDFEIENSEQQDKLVALLANQGFEGFEEEEDNLAAYIPEHLLNEVEFSAVMDKFENIIYTKTIIENINWNKKWEEDFKPVIIGDFAAIRAGFHAPIRDVEYEIIITPKMSFGTGHHATTHLMIQQMQALNFTGKTVLDFGTGTGILAILASKQGASDVLAIDYDEWSINNTNENIMLNHCNNIVVQQADSIESTRKFDVVLANINLNVILTNIATISQVANTGATILLSGFLKENEPLLMTELQANGLKNLTTLQRGDWIMVMAKMEGN